MSLINAGGLTGKEQIMCSCRAETTVPVVPRRSGVSIIIPYPGGDTAALQTTLDSVSRAGTACGAYEILVVDDSGRDELQVSDKGCSHAFRLIVNQRKRGFVDTCNRGILAAFYPVVVCMQPSCTVGKDSIIALVNHFADQTVFAVTPTLYYAEESVDAGDMRWNFSRGFFKISVGGASANQRVCTDLYTHPRIVAYDREKFIELGGFSDLYAPDLYEDVDISFRALKRGWRTLHAPQAIARLPVQSSPQGASQIERQRKQVNFLLLHWSNITDEKLFRQHVAWCAALVVLAAVRLDFEWLAAFRLAWRARHKARSRRRQLASESGMTDKEIFLVTGSWH